MASLYRHGHVMVWALWICHEMLTAVMQLTMRTGDDWLLDKRATPDVSAGMAHTPYVDSGNLVGTSVFDAQNRVSDITGQLDAIGLKWHEKVGVQPEIGVLGVVLPRAAREWRFYAGCGALLQSRIVVGWQVRALVGSRCSSSRGPS